MIFSSTPNHNIGGNITTWVNCKGRTAIWFISAQVKKNDVPSSRQSN